MKSKPPELPAGLPGGHGRGKTINSTSLRLWRELCFMWSTANGGSATNNGQEAASEQLQNRAAPHGTLKRCEPGSMWVCKATGLIRGSANAGAGEAGTREQGWREGRDPGAGVAVGRSH